MRVATTFHKEESVRKALAYFRRVDAVMYEAARKVDFKEWFGERVKARTVQGYFVALAREIVGQQLSGHVAKIIFARFKDLFPKRQVTPSRILKISDQDLRNTGMAWAKVASLKDLARKIQEKKLRIKQLHALHDEEVVKKLIQVRGIGRWTAEMFLIFTLQREDVFSVGDLGLRKGCRSCTERKKFQTGR